MRCILIFAFCKSGVKEKKKSSWNDIKYFVAKFWYSFFSCNLEFVLLDIERTVSVFCMKTAHDSVITVYSITHLMAWPRVESSGCKSKLLYKKTRAHSKIIIIKLNFIAKLLLTRIWNHFEWLRAVSERESTWNEKYRTEQLKHFKIRKPN